MTNRFAPLGIAVLLLAACAQAGAPTPSDAPAETPQPSRPGVSIPPVQTVEPSKGGTVIGEVPDEILLRILADAADRTGVAEDAIEVLRAEAVTWTDGSLDCPEPGMMYTQALVDGYHVVVEGGGAEVDYRVGTGGSFRVCEQPDRPAR